MISLVGMAVRNVVALQYGFVSCTFCRNLYFVKLFSKLERSFTPSRYAIFLLSFTIVRGASSLRVPLQVFAWRFKSSRGASSLRVVLQVFAWRFKSSRGASSFRVALQVFAWCFKSSRGASSLRVALQVFAWRFKSLCGASSLRVGLRVLLVRCGNIGFNNAISLKSGFTFSSGKNI